MLVFEEFLDALKHFHKYCITQGLTWAIYLISLAARGCKSETLCIANCVRIWVGRQKKKLVWHDKSCHLKLWAGNSCHYFCQMWTSLWEWDWKYPWLLRGWLKDNDWKLRYWGRHLWIHLKGAKHESWANVRNVLRSVAEYHAPFEVDLAKSKNQLRLHISHGSSASNVDEVWKPWHSQSGPCFRVEAEKFLSVRFVTNVSKCGWKALLGIIMSVNLHSTRALFSPKTNRESCDPNHRCGIDTLIKFVFLFVTLNSWHVYLTEHSGQKATA